MNTAAAPTAAADGLTFHHLAIAGALSGCVKAMLAVELDEPRPLSLAVAPHESLMLGVGFTRGPRGIEPKTELGHNTLLTGLRRWTGAYTGDGCLALFALLTPLGAVRLLDSRVLQDMPRINAPVAELLDERVTRELESALVLAGDTPSKLRAFAAWLEARATGERRQSRAALRAGRAAMRLCADPTADVDRIADEQHVSRRQLERDFERWLGASPRHMAQVARVQEVSRLARAGATLADAAAGAGFADQSHMNRVVRQLTGLTPRSFVQSMRTPIAAAFRAATGGGTVYL